MLDKQKLRERREKEAQESVNVWQDFLGSTDENKKEEPKKDDKKKK
jgi:hypothetical protein